MVRGVLKSYRKNILREMKDNLSRYTLRIDQTLLDKLGYIAEYEGRTKNRELEQMIKIQFCFGCTNSRRRIAPQRGFVIS